MGSSILPSIFLLLNFYLVYEASASGIFRGNDKIMKVELGQSIDQLTKVMGKATTLNTEKFSSAEYEVWEYATVSGQPLGFFTIDSKTKRISGRSIEGLGSGAGDDIGKLLNEHFKNGNFSKYIPCRGRGDEEVRVDIQQGIFVAARDSKVSLVSWADPQLTKLRIDQFYSKCPQLQPGRKAK